MTTSKEILDHHGIRTMTVAQLVEHIKADNLEQSIAFQLAGTGYVQVKTRDCEEFETLLAHSGDRPFMFTGRKEASEFVDNLVKETRASFSRPSSQPQNHDGISTVRKVYESQQQVDLTVPAEPDAEAHPEYTCFCPACDYHSASAVLVDDSQSYFYNVTCSNCGFDGDKPTIHPAPDLSTVSVDKQ